MKCGGCQAINREERHFCRRCGNRLQLHCPRCGFSNEISDRYCGGCGAVVHETSAHSQAVPKAAASHAAVKQSSLPQDFLEDLMKEDQSGPSEDAGKPKHSITQDEIDRMVDD